LQDVAHDRSDDWTRSCAVYVQDIVTSQNHIIDIVRKIDPGKVWETSRASTLDLDRQAHEAFERKDPDIISMTGSIFRMYFGGDVFNQLFQKLDNESLGIPGMDDPDLESLILKIMRS
jgi:hypothetical protein